jgi:hypothetical protein
MDKIVMNLEDFGNYDLKDRLRTNFCFIGSSLYCAYTHNLKEKRGQTEIKKNVLSYIW